MIKFQAKFVITIIRILSVIFIISIPLGIIKFCELFFNFLDAIVQFVQGAL